MFAFFQRLSLEQKKKFALGGLVLVSSGFLVFFLYLFSPSTNEPDEVVSPSPDDLPLFATDETLKEMDDLTRQVLLDSVWEQLARLDAAGAVSSLETTFSTYQLPTDDEFQNWYHDVYLVDAITSVPLNDKPPLLRAFKTPRFQAIIPILNPVLAAAAIIDDGTSLVPCDVQQFQIVEERFAEPDAFNDESVYYEEFSQHLQSIYEVQLIVNGESLVGRVGVHKNGTLTLLGYRSLQEETMFKEDAHWEERRDLYETIPVFQ